MCLVRGFIGLRRSSSSMLQDSEQGQGRLDNCTVGLICRWFGRIRLLETARAYSFGGHRRYVHVFVIMLSCILTKFFQATSRILRRWMSGEAGISSSQACCPLLQALPPLVPCSLSVRSFSLLFYGTAQGGIILANDHMKQLTRHTSSAWPRSPTPSP